jgi:hypothetical protein
MTEQEYAELWRLRMRWLGIYHVALAEGVWRAKRYHDVTHVLTASSLTGLAEQIQHDYAGYRICSTPDWRRPYLT